MIVIDDNYGIETDALGNYSLFRRKIVKKGKAAGEETRSYVGHFSNLQGAVRACIRDRFNAETEDLEISLAEAVRRLEAIEKDLTSVLRF